MPLTWGGTRRVALEAGADVQDAARSRGSSAASAIWQRENPGFVLEPEEDDDSTTGASNSGRAERNFAHTLHRRRGDARVGGLRSATDDRSVDDRRGRGARHAEQSGVPGQRGLSRRRLERARRATAAPSAINRYTLDAPRLPAPVRPAGARRTRVHYLTADAPLPIHERWLIGGSVTLRGFRTGDVQRRQALVTSAELRVPITSVISGAKLGVNVFTDAAKVGDDGDAWRTRRWQHERRRRASS